MPGIVCECGRIIMRGAEEASFTLDVSYKAPPALVAEFIPQQQDKSYEPVESSEYVMQPRQAITSLLFAGVLAPIFASHSFHHQSAGEIPVD